MIKFRKLTDDDLPLIERWLNKAHVKKWYEIPRLGVTIEEWLSEIREYKGLYKWITYLIVMEESKPIGMCLYYKCEDSKDEEFGTLRLQGAYGIDYFIGEESKLKKGLGKEMVELLVSEISSISGVQRITAEADHENIASGKTLQTCGFQLISSTLSGYDRYKIEIK